MRQPHGLRVLDIQWMLWPSMNCTPRTTRSTPAWAPPRTSPPCTCERTSLSTVAHLNDLVTSHIVHIPEFASQTSGIVPGVGSRTRTKDCRVCPCLAPGSIAPTPYVRHGFTAFQQRPILGVAMGAIEEEVAWKFQIEMHISRTFRACGRVHTTCKFRRCSLPCATARPYVLLPAISPVFCEPRTVFCHTSHCEAVQAATPVSSCSNTHPSKQVQLTT